LIKKEEESINGQALKQRTAREGKRKIKTEKLKDMGKSEERVNK
jgi:hypothetical protein